jgi:peptidoglycan/xylan/chitin deacetylase (PgdA/CDA1 family)
MDAATFERHADCIAESGAVAMTVGQLAHALRTGQGPERAVAITFDDGFATVVREALPLLRERGLPATLFCVAGHLGGLNDFATDPQGIPKRTLASADELRAAVGEGGLEVGSHGMLHRPLRGLAAERLHEEVVGSKAHLEAAVGTRVTTLAYPYAVIPDAVGLELARTTYGAACASGLAIAGDGADPHLLPRVDAHYLRRTGLLRRALEGRLGAYMAVRRAGARLKRVARSDHRAG